MRKPATPQCAVWSVTDGAAAPRAYRRPMSDGKPSVLPVREQSSSSPAGVFNRVLVGFDERPASRDALILAGELSRWSEGELIVASVRPYWPDLLGPAGYAKAVGEDEAWL